MTRSPAPPDVGPYAGGVPARALILSLLALAVPVLATVAAPVWLEREGALIVWLPALLPAFLLTYHRGWRGASLALAGGMAALALSQVEILLLDLPAPGWPVVFGLVALLVLVALGTGWLSDLLHRERATAERTALTDSLTGLPNRRHATVFLEAGWGTVLRGGTLAVALFDLDHFKEVNDRHGHAQGDRVLRAFAGVLTDRTRRMDVSARYGGEEFVSILTGCGIDEAEAFAEDVRRGLDAIEFGWGRVSVSAGVSAVEEGMGSPEVLLAAADRALYAAKDEGRNRTWRSDRPLPASVRPAVRRGRPLPSDLDGLDVLVVDDEPVTLAATSRLLTRLGCRVRSLASPRDALAILAGGRPPHILVTDVVMPDMSGFTLVDLASRVVSDLPVLYISGYAREDVYWGGTPGSRSAFLGKPLEVEELRQTLRRLLGDGAAFAADPDGAEAAAAVPRTDRPARRAGDLPGGSRRAHHLPGRILVVDDDAAVVRSLQRLFRRAGYAEPIGLTDPTLVAGTVTEEEVDLVVLDLNMPGMDGFQVLGAIGSHLDPEEYLPILAITGDDDPWLRRRALAAGAHDFLGKPFDTAEAEARARNLLETRFLNQRVARQRDEMERRVAVRTKELADTRTEILHRLARAAEYRDDVTGRHAERVGLLSSLVAEELGFGPADVDIVRRTAPLHDIGKIGVPDAVLRKPGSLTPSEFQLMKTHTTIGAQILGGSEHRILQVASRIAEAHHERWDGRGYPYGLAADRIPREARIVAVVDSFDTLTHTRPYKAPIRVEEAVAEIRRCREAHFDPDVVEAFRRICDRVGLDGLIGMADPLDPERDTHGGPLAGDGR